MPSRPLTSAENHTEPLGARSAHTSCTPWPSGTRYSCTVTCAQAGAETRSASANNFMAGHPSVRRLCGFVAVSGTVAQKVTSPMTATDKAADALDLSLQVGEYDIQKLLGKGATGT